MPAEILAGRAGKLTVDLHNGYKMIMCYNFCENRLNLGIPSGKKTD